MTTQGSQCKNEVYPKKGRRGIKFKGNGKNQKGKRINSSVSNTLQKLFLPGIDGTSTPSNR